VAQPLSGPKCRIEFDGLLRTLVEGGMIGCGDVPVTVLPTVAEIIGATVQQHHQAKGKKYSHAAKVGWLET